MKLNNVTYHILDLFHVSRFLSSGSRHSWVNVASPRVSQVYFLHSHLLKQRKKNSTIVFSRLSKKDKKWKRLIASVRRENDVKYHPSHRRCIKNTLVLALTFFLQIIIIIIIVIWCKGDIIQSIMLQMYSFPAEFGYFNTVAAGLSGPNNVILTPTMQILPGEPH